MTLALATCDRAPGKLYSLRSSPYPTVTPIVGSPERGGSPKSHWDQAFLTPAVVAQPSPASSSLLQGHLSHLKLFFHKV